MDGHPFQIEQNIRLSRNFEQWKLTEPHRLVPNSKVDVLRKVPLGFYLSPRRPILTLSQLLYVPRKAEIN